MEFQEIGMTRELAKEKMDAYQEAERFLNIQENENKELEYTTKQLEKELSVFKDERQKLLDVIDSYSLEVYYEKCFCELRLFLIIDLDKLTLIF